MFHYYYCTNTCQISNWNAHTLASVFESLTEYCSNLLDAGNSYRPQWCDLVLKQEPLLTPPGRWAEGFAGCSWMQKVAAWLAKSLLPARCRSAVTGGGIGWSCRLEFIQQFHIVFDSSLTRLLLIRTTGALAKHFWMGSSWTRGVLRWRMHCGIHHTPFELLHACFSHFIM